MEFGWTDEQQAYRERIRAFLAKTLPDDWEQTALHGPGSDAQTEYSRGFCKLLAADGLLIPHWPVEHGGEETSAWDQYGMSEEMWAAGEPRGPQYMNVNWVGPVLMRYGTAEQQDKHLPRIKEGEAIWCQGFSEPSAGSDLAALRTMAVPVEGGYSVTGAKVWTSYATHADYCFLLARTAPTGKAGIVILLVDMKSPGIQVKQIPALIGEGDIHEVFFDEVFVPAIDRLGAEGQAWEIINYALQNERVGIPRYAFSRSMLDRAVAQFQDEGRFDDDPVLQDRAGRALALTQAARMLVYRVVDQRAHNAPPDAFGALARWSVVNSDNGVNNFLTEFRPEGLLGEDDFQQAHHQRAIAAGIASGAAEIQLNIAARRYLELPSGDQRGL
jgi:alkylation response protein AidB-like acyl-CoA dehydrogenase